MQMWLLLRNEIRKLEKEGGKMRSKKKEALGEKGEPGS